METYIIRVNGEEFEVEVEKKGESSSSASDAHASPEKRQMASDKKAPVNGTPVVCGTSGKVFSIVCSEGQAVKSGDTIIVLEAMKMEIPVVAPEDGIVSSIAVSEGENTSSGQIVAYIS